MKTTFDLPEPLVREVQELARSQGTTARSVVEQALVRLLKEDQSATTFELREASFTGGSGMSEEFAGTSWAKIRDAAYGIESER